MDKKSELNIKDKQISQSFPISPVDKVKWPWTSPSYKVNRRIDGIYCPKITVVMPSYNQGKFIEESIRSVLLQDYDNLEFIIIDGGSTDNSVDIIKKYDQWISYWVSERDNGQADALKKGFARASGDIIAWLNSDDMYCPETLHSVGGFYANNREVGLIYGDSEMIDATGAAIERIKGQNGDLQRLLTKNFIPQPSAFFSRKAFNAVGGINADLHFIMDYELWIRMMLRGTSFHYLPITLSRFRWYPDSKSGSYSTQFGKEYLRYIEKLFQENHDRTLQNVKLKAFNYGFMMIVACNRQGADDEDILHTLSAWSDHINQHSLEYQEDVFLLSDSLYRIGDAYLIQGEMKKGRMFIEKSLSVRTRVIIMALVSLFISYLGYSAYMCYVKSLRSVKALMRRFI